MITMLFEIKRFAEDNNLQYEVGKKDVEQITRTTSGFMIVYPTRMKFIPLQNVDSVRCDDAMDVFESPCDVKGCLKMQNEVAQLRKKIDEIETNMMLYVAVKKPLEKLEGL
jgi:hypothetical protein